MKKILQTIGTVALVIMMIDMIGFMAWVYSGQHPMDNFYVGTITAHILKLFL
jgi:hypothetical protein